MKKIKKLNKRINNYLFDHSKLKDSVSFMWSFFLGVLGAALYAFGFVSFIVPFDASTDFTIITGGVGGISQNIGLILKMNGINIDAETMQSIFYFVINIPILVFAFFCIGKKFSILTLFNVGLSSLFILLFKKWDFALEVRRAAADQTTLFRALFAGVFVGAASGITFKGEISCGGIDVFSYYFAIKKSTSVGKYATAINLVIVLLYSIMLGSSGTMSWANAFISILFSLAYLFTTMIMVDLINVRNKKVQITIVSAREDLSMILIANFPHGTTVSSAKGGYSGSEKHVVNIVVSSFEMKKVIKVIKQADQHAFITVQSLMQVYGNFFIKPIE